MKTSFITLLLLISFPGRGLIRWQSFIWYGCAHYNFLQYTAWRSTDPRAEIWHAASLFRENISAGASSNLFGGRDRSKAGVWWKEEERRWQSPGCALLGLRYCTYWCVTLSKHRLHPAQSPRVHREWKAQHNSDITLTVRAFSSADPRFVLNGGDNKGVALTVVVSWTMICRRPGLILYFFLRVCWLCWKLILVKEAIQISMK